MEHEYKGVKITTSQNELTGKWGASFALPMDNGDVTNTEFWAENEDSILHYVENLILLTESGEYKLNFPE